jgi:hypothetical protein
MKSARQQKHANGAFGSPILIPSSDIDLFLQHTADNYRPLNPQQLTTHQIVARPSQPNIIPQKLWLTRYARTPGSGPVSSRGVTAASRDSMWGQFGGVDMLVGPVAQIQPVQERDDDRHGAGDDEGPAPTSGHPDDSRDDEAADRGAERPAASMKVAPRARSLAGNQFELNLAPAGKTGASDAPRPSRSCPASSIQPKRVGVSTLPALCFADGGVAAPE